jgi:hypothetical protein
MKEIRTCRDDGRGVPIESSGIYDQGYRRILRTVYGRGPSAPLHCAYPVARLRSPIPWSVLTGRRRPMQQTNERNQLIVQALLAVLATILAIASWFQVFG